MVKIYAIWILALLLLLTTLSLAAFGQESIELNETQCTEGNGTWVSQKTNPNYLGKPFCKCPSGYTWKNNSCVQLTNQELCENTRGTWVSGNCICPEKSTGFVNNIGCDYKANVTLENKTPSQDIEVTQKSPKVVLTILIILLFLSIIVVIIKYKPFKKK